MASVWLSEDSGWTFKSMTKIYKPLKGSSYIELTPELRNSAKGLTFRIKTMNALDSVIFNI